MTQYAFPMKSATRRRSCGCSACASGDTASGHAVSRNTGHADANSLFQRSLVSCVQAWKDASFCIRAFESDSSSSACP